MRSKKGKLLPKMGKDLHGSEPPGGQHPDYVGAIAEALRRELGTTHQAIKLAMRWTGASERTVKYWFAGASGPSGEHLIALARHSDSVLDTFLQLAMRHRHARALRVLNAHKALECALEAIRNIADDEAAH